MTSGGLVRNAQPFSGSGIRSDRVSRLRSGSETPRCVRDARPEGRDAAALERSQEDQPGCLARRWPGAVGNGGIVAYRARSPARSAAEGHAHIKPFAVPELCPETAYYRPANPSE